MPKIWPKEGQNFPKYKKFKILSGDENNHSKKNHFLLQQTKNYFARLFFGFFGLDDPQRLLGELCSVL